MSLARTRRRCRREISQKARKPRSAGASLRESSQVRRAWKHDYRRWAERSRARCRTVPPRAPARSAAPCDKSAEPLPLSGPSCNRRNPGVCSDNEGSNLYSSVFKKFRLQNITAQEKETIYIVSLISSLIYNANKGWLAMKEFCHWNAKLTLGWRLAFTLACFVFADERRRSHPRVGELEILMEIVQAVEEVPHVSSKYREHAIVTILTDESYEVHAHLIEELLFRHAEYLR